MEHEPVKTVLSEISERFRPWWRGKDPRQTVQRLNDEAAYIVGRYANAREIEIGPFENCISIYNAPDDILPFIPLFFREISIHGTYTVMRGMKMLGRVTYRGMPEQDKPGKFIVGVETNFMPEVKARQVIFTMVIGDESGPLPEDFGKEGSRWNISRK